jgi:parvulin-like peptidyl-prolyl isomerase
MKSLIVAIILCTMMAGVSAEGTDSTGEAVVARVNELQVTAKEIKAGIGLQIWRETKDAIQKEKIVEGLVRDILQRKILARNAREDLEGKNKQDQFLIKLATDKALSDLYLDHKIRQTVDGLPIEMLAKEEFRAYPEKYMKDRAKARHILVMNHPSCQNNPEDQIANLKSRIEAGEAFETLAGKYSDDKPSAMKGGDLGWITRGRTVKEFEEALFKLRTPGELSSPVKTQYGIHLIQLNEYEPGDKVTFKDVQGEIMDEIRLKKIKETRANILNNLIETDRMFIDAEAVKNIAEAL